MSDGIEQPAIVSIGNSLVFMKRLLKPSERGCTKLDDFVGTSGEG